MPTLHELSTVQLRQALQLREQIGALQLKLDAILGGKGTAGKVSKAKGKLGRKPGKRTMSPEARAKIAAAQHARWAKTKGSPAKSAAKPAPAPKKKGGLTDEGRAKLAAAMKARWAAKKKAGLRRTRRRNRVPLNRVGHPGCRAGASSPAACWRSPCHLHPGLPSCQSSRHHTAGEDASPTYRKAYSVEVCSSRR